LIIIGVVAFVVTGLVVISVANKITKPMGVFDEFMSDTTKKGDIVWKPEELALINQYQHRKDEIGRLFNSYIDLIAVMNEICDELKSVADGNLDVEIRVRSEHDLLSLTLQKMVDDLNSMFSEINTAATQVSTGSKQIADGSQILAQGSTEQAASVQQLSASISEISEKTKNNAKMAERAAMLATDIKGSAEKGSRQMDEMMSAVKDINDSSQNISKVIKSIDDIAFQTNILALNAAVEAARAGQHGKGFAVVAEEVRNLAAKSAVAAKDTESLIADSIEKAELGSKIADNTAASLVEIVSGIGESSQLVDEIAKSSEEQSEGIAQINRGIDQVAQVVQQTSATAEQAAATSQEMSGQSMMLEGLIARFKLRDAGGFKSLTSASQGLPNHVQNENIVPNKASDENVGKY